MSDNSAGQPVPIHEQELAESLMEQIAAKPLPDTKAMDGVCLRQGGGRTKPLNDDDLPASADGVEEEMSGPTLEGSLQANEKADIFVPTSSVEDYLTEGTALQSKDIKMIASVSNDTRTVEGTVDNPIIVEGDTEGDTDASASIEDHAKNEEAEMLKTYGLLKELLSRYTGSEGRAKGIAGKRSFETYCLSHKLDGEENTRTYLEGQEDWVDKLLEASEALNAHLHPRKKKLCGALSRAR